MSYNTAMGLAARSKRSWYYEWELVLSDTAALVSFFRGTAKLTFKAVTRNSIVLHFRWRDRVHVRRLPVPAAEDPLIKIIFQCVNDYISLDYYRFSARLERMEYNR